MARNEGNGHGYGGDEEPTPALGGIAPFSAEARELVNIALAIGAAAASVWRVARSIDTVEGAKRDLAVAECTVALGELVDAAYAAKRALMAVKGDTR